MMYIDLSMTLNEVTPIYPGTAQPEFKRVARCDVEGWNEHEVRTSTHFGTHIDAPWHFREDGKKLSEYSIDQFIGRAILFDVRGQKIIDANVDELEAGDFAIFRTDHTKRVGTEDYFDSIPVIGLPLVEKLVAKKIKMIGIDSPSPDQLPYLVHKALFQHDILILEHLVNLDLLPSRKFTMFALPLNYDQLDGSPCRVVAVVGE